MLCPKLSLNQICASLSGFRDNFTTHPVVLSKENCRSKVANKDKWGIQCLITNIRDLEQIRSVKRQLKILFWAVPSLLHIILWYTDISMRKKRWFWKIRRIQQAKLCQYAAALFRKHNAFTVSKQLLSKGGLLSELGKNRGINSKLQKSQKYPLVQLVYKHKIVCYNID